MISLCRTSTSVMSFGNSPRAFQRSTWNARVSRRGTEPRTHSIGVFEIKPPSQKYSLPILVAGKPGGSEPEAAICSKAILCLVLSK